jgi:hypothetical protein
VLATTRRSARRATRRGVTSRRVDVRAAAIGRAGLRVTVAAALTVCALGAAGCRSGPPEAVPRFAERVPGVVRDAATGLDWTSRDQDDALPWDAADRRCRDLVLGEHDDWRLPEVGELAALYDPAHDEPCGERRCRLDPAFRLRGPYVWTATARGVGARFYKDFMYGNELSPSVGPQLVRRVLCVRGGESGTPEPHASGE